MIHKHSCRRYRWLAVLVAVLMVVVAFASCKSTASVKIMDTAASQTSSTADANAPDPTPGSPAPTQPAPTEPAPTQPTEPSAAATEEPRFDLQGEIPLTSGEVNGLIDFIEQETGRPFLQPPVIVAQSEQEFFDGLTDDIGDFQTDAEIDIRVLQALGLTDRGVGEVADAFEALLLSPEGIAGYYDPETDELYVPVAADGDDAFRSLLVHELTHALDGQYVDLTALDDLVEQGEMTGNFEPVIALQAMGEGRASSVQNRWIGANGVTPEVPDDLGAINDVPPALVLALSIPYAFGEQYVNINGGAAATWGALENPPPSSEVFMVPGTPSDQAIIDVPTPDADGPVLDEVVFGAADIFVWLLGESLEPDPALLFPVFGAIDGWAGGRAVLWGDDTESCVRIALAGDTDSDLVELQEVTETWAADNPSSRSVTNDGDVVVVTGCAPYLP